MNLYEIVFSATGRTQKVTDIVSSVFDENKIKIELSNPNFKEKLYDIPQDSLYALYIRMTKKSKSFVSCIGICG